MRPTTEDLEALELLEKLDTLTEWEEEFLQELDDGFPWTEYQAMKFDQIWTRRMEGS